MSIKRPTAKTVIKCTPSCAMCVGLNGHNYCATWLDTSCHVRSYEEATNHNHIILIFELLLTKLLKEFFNRNRYTIFQGNLRSDRKHHT